MCNTWYTTNYIEQAAVPRVATAISLLLLLRASVEECKDEVAEVTIALNIQTEKQSREGKKITQASR